MMRVVTQVKKRIVVGHVYFNVNQMQIGMKKVMTKVVTLMLVEV